MPEPTTDLSIDLTVLARLYKRSSVAAVELIDSILSRIAAYPDPAVWTLVLPRSKILAQVQELVGRKDSGEFLPLFGVPFAVKDNIDVAGYPTTAGCPSYAYQPEQTAPVVERLQNAGAILIGKTNLDQFATGLAGDRSPYGICRNVFNADYISGGSSSGSAVAVAAGLVSFALGTDTAGSGRVPASCNNIVGLKPAPGLLDTQGVVPACRSLDCVSIFALTSADAQVIAEVAQQPKPANLPSLCEGDTVYAESGAGFSFAVPGNEDLEFHGDADQPALFRKACGLLKKMGGRLQEMDFTPFRQVGDLLYGGPWLAERLASLEEFIKRRPEEIHPVTLAIITRGASYSAVDLFRGMDNLRSLRAICAKTFEWADVLVVPTIPTLPSLAEVASDSIGWSRRLGYYTSFVNLLGLAAIALPCDFDSRGLPVGITVIGPAGSERRLCELGQAWQRLVALPLGATSGRLPEESPSQQQESSARGGQAERTYAVSSRPSSVAAKLVRVAVAGAHLRGQPLHPALLETGARLIRSCQTAPRYRFVALMNLDPPRPGLLRDDQRGGAATVEIYDLPMEGFGRLVASVAPPLAIGTIELEDGEAVKGFLCESHAAAQARDITDFGGWLAFRMHGEATPKP